MKSKIYLLLFMLVMVSCEDQLNYESVSSLSSAGFWDSYEKAEAALIGLYADFRGGSSDNDYNIWKMGEVRSDIWGGQTVENWSDKDLIEQNISISNVPFANWANLYSLIHKLNDFIKNVPDISFTDEDKKNHMLGQAHGLRAHIYYILFKTWGKVPITLEPQTDIDLGSINKARSSEAEVMDVIKDDIQKSLDYFGNNYSFWNEKRVYWSKAATLALKGDVYIWSGTNMGGGSTDYTVAKTALEDVATAGISLMDNFVDVFNVKNNDEIVFALNYELDQNTNYYYLLTARTTDISTLFREDGSSISDYVVNGGNRYGPNNDILNKLDDPLDSRRNATFMRLYDDNSGYSTYNEEHYAASIMIKFDGSVESGMRYMTDDVPVYRYADVLLLLAEAKNLLGEDPSSEINQIRQRAYGTNYVPATHAYSNGTKDENIASILDERLKEFIGEGKRWWDLRRAGDSWVINNNAYLFPGDEYKLVLPISIEMIGRNNLLEQTDGY